ncbi:unnamed protein product, partial [Amoebophrya sp. A120]
IGVHTSKNSRHDYHYQIELKVVELRLVQLQRILTRNRSYTVIRMRIRMS